MKKTQFNINGFSVVIAEGKYKITTTITRLGSETALDLFDLVVFEMGLHKDFTAVYADGCDTKGENPWEFKVNGVDKETCVAIIKMAIAKTTAIESAVLSLILGQGIGLVA